MKLLRTVFWVSVLILNVGTLLAGTIDSKFEAHLNSLAPDELVTVMVVMQEQSDIQELDQQLRSSKSSFSHRHQVIVSELQNMAQATQGHLLTGLEAGKATGEVAGYTTHWLINAVVVRATAGVVFDMAFRADVHSIEPNLMPELIQPVMSEKTVPAGDRGIGITPGLLAINTRRVWDELGVDGTGTIVGIIDTGVDLFHPALQSRWQGFFSTPAEAWHQHPAGQQYTFPVDNMGHGTHVMGTITGLAADDTIGVAPGAHWIVSNAVDWGVDEYFDGFIIAALEFMTDPDGDPETSGDVPAVVQNSWGVDERWPGYIDCDSQYWDAIDNCEAAGVVLVWSAGNEGELFGAGSIRSPADRADTPYNCFSVGSTETAAPYEISPFSSLGPSGCGGEFAIKPEVSGPGTDIYSAQAGGGYHYLSGTSMAGPHVAGVVALMRSANPDLDVVTVKQILMETAYDRGVPGEDNVYGHGLIDAYAAVLAAMEDAGYVEGTVSGSDGVEAVYLASINVVDGFQTPAPTDADGYYQQVLLAGNYELEFNAFGYEETVAAITITGGQVLMQDAQLQARARYGLSGVVYDPQGLPIPNAVISYVNAPLLPQSADAMGDYSLNLYGPFEYLLSASAPGLSPDVVAVDPSAVSTLDFHLHPQSLEDFESGDFSTYQWVQTGEVDWLVTDEEPHGGNWSARSGILQSNGFCRLEIERTMVGADLVTFSLRVSSELNYDCLAFLIDNEEAARWSGEVPWTEVIIPVPAGLHTFAWEYRKDASVDHGLDSAWLDNIQLPWQPVFSDINDQIPTTGPIFQGAVPNPFNPKTSLVFLLPTSRHLEVVVYDLAGRMVRILASEVFPAGKNSLAWNGTNTAGQVVASGTYFARLKGEGIDLVRSMVLVR